MRGSAVSQTPVQSSSGLLKGWSIAVCIAAALSWNACHSALPLYRVLTPEGGDNLHAYDGHFLTSRPEPRAAPVELSQKRASANLLYHHTEIPFPEGKYAVLSYARGTRALLRRLTNGLRFEVDLLEQEDLGEYVRLMLPAGNYGRFVRLPEAFGVRIRVMNGLNRDLPVDFRRFSLTRHGGTPAFCGGARKYYERYYSAGSFPLLHEWAFSQKPLPTLLHPLPDYVILAREPRSGSELEYQQQRERWLKERVRRERRAAVLPAGEVVEGVCLFPKLQPGTYRLAYPDRVNGFTFAPITFSVELRTDEAGAVPKAARPAQKETAGADRIMLELRGANLAEAQRERDLTYRLHGLHREHERVRKVAEDRQQREASRKGAADAGWSSLWRRLVD